MLQEFRKKSDWKNQTALGGLKKQVLFMLEGSAEYSLEI
jgi:hypothetical protein